MPLVMIKSLPTDAKAVSKMLSEVRDKGAEAFKCPPSNVWVTYEELPKEHYLHPEEHPPIVVIKAQAGRSEELKKALMEAVANAVGKKAWIQYEEINPKDIRY